MFRSCIQNALLPIALALSASLHAAQSTDSKVPGDAPVVPVQATVETSLKTAAPQIRMFAFDGDPNSYFASANDMGADDHFTLVFDKAVALKSVVVTTGRVKGGDELDKGTLEVSEDGKKFEPLAEFANGEAKGDAKGHAVLAVRIKSAGDLKHPLAVREFVLESEPKVAVFKYPVEVLVDVSDAPEMKDWTEQAARINERAYQMICAELMSDGFTPKTVVPMTMRKDSKFIAVTYNASRIVGQVKYFTEHPKDFGAMVHEMVHVVQNYRGRNPGWLVEGLADYIRNYKWEPQKPRKLRPESAKYDGSYQITARFLAYLIDKYDPQIVNTLNKLMREGKYNEDTFKNLTKKSASELGDEWEESLGAPALGRHEHIHAKAIKGV